MAKQRVVIAGASGLIGSALTRSLLADDISVTTLVRRPARAGEVEWLTSGRPLDPQVLAGASAVVCLNGASIGKLPWGAAYRETLRTSRIVPTRTIATALRELGSKAPAFLSASGAGYYGNRPGEQLTETSGPGDTFLAKLCVEWERAALTAGSEVRVALLRTAPLLHRQGVLKPLLTLTRLGVSGPLGRGTQVWPWISLEDEVRAIRHIIDSKVAGPVNLTGPVTATANEIGQELAKQMKRPFWLPAPAWALRLGLGSAADSLLLPDAHVEPQVLEQSGFTFEHRTAAEAIQAALT
jgi:uncharacterized protein (TIGR01777 family)